MKVSPTKIYIYSLDGKYFCQINAIGHYLSDEEISRADVICAGLSTVKVDEL